MKNAKKIISLMLALVLLFSLAACGKGGNGGKGGKHIENLVIGTISKPEDVNIYSQNGSNGKFEYNQIVDCTLFVLDENNELAPYFIKEYSISPDGKELKLVFPTDKHWHDGEPVTIDDIAFNFEWRRDVLGSSTLKNLTEVRRDADNQVTLIFSQPDAYYLIRSNPITFRMLPKHIWEKLTKEDYADYNGEGYQVGCGPYKLASMDLDAGIVTYEAYPGNNYLGELVVDKITLRTYSDMSACLMALANGEIDYMYNYASGVPYTLLDLIKGNDTVDPGRTPYSGNPQATFGMNKPYNQYKEFRKAVILSIDWDLVRNVFSGEYGQNPGSGVISPSNTGYDDSLWKFYTDRDEAARLLDEAGFKDVNGDGFREMPDGTAFEYKVSSQMTASKQEMFNRTGEVIVDGLKKIGINASYDTDCLSSSEANKAMVTNNEYDLFIGYTTSGVANYRTAIWYFLNRAVAGSGGYNWGNSLDDETLNNAYRALQKANNDEEYIAAVKGLQKIMSEELYGFALCWEDYFFPYRTDKYEGLDFFPSIGVITYETFYNLKAK